jgi:hypothetical protein
MKTIKTFEQYSLVREFLKSDSPKLENLIKGVESMADEKLSKDISKTISVLQVDPYTNFEEVILFLRTRHKDNPEVLKVLDAAEKFDGSEVTPDDEAEESGPYDFD